MEFDVNDVMPGMILQSDIIGKTGRPLFRQNLHLEAEHITYLKKFLIKKVNVAPLEEKVVHQFKALEEKQTLKAETKSLFLHDYQSAVKQYRTKFYEWKREVPILMNDINKIGFSLLKEVENQELSTIVMLMDDCAAENAFFESTMASSILSVYLAKRLGYAKKEWMQIGYASLLKDCGLIQFDDKFITGERLTASEKERYTLHPAYSYKLVESLKTLTQPAKIAILQHHERNDGKGYPGKVLMERIHPYAKIISVSDYFYMNLYKQKSLQRVITFLRDDNSLSKDIVEQLIEDLTRDDFPLI